VKNRVGIRVYKIWREGGGERGVLELGEEERERVPPERAVDGTSARELGEPKPYQRRMTGEEEEGLCLIFALFVLGGFSTENFESK
jgi:hypothetical protein